MLVANSNSYTQEDSDVINMLMDNNDSPFRSTSYSTSSYNRIYVNKCETTRKAIKFILANAGNKYENLTLVSNTQKQKFQACESMREYPEQMFKILIKCFTEFYDIDLNIISYNNGQLWEFEGENQQTLYGKRKKAFLLFKQDNSVHGPLYTINLNSSIQTVFSSQDFGIEAAIILFLNQMNDTNVIPYYPERQEQQDTDDVQMSIEDSSFDRYMAASTDQAYAAPVNNKMECRAVIDRLPDQVFRQFHNLFPCPSAIQPMPDFFLSNPPTFEHLSHQDTVVTLQDRADYLTNLIQMAEQPMVSTQGNHVNTTYYSSDSHQEEQHNLAPALLDFVSPSDNTANTGQTHPLTMLQSLPVPINYNSPTLAKPLHSTWHPRTLNEFATNGSSPIKSVDSKQRDPIQIGVPPQDDGAPLYLGIGVFDVNYNVHPMKVCVPHKATVIDKSLMNKNDLQCLNFKDRDPPYTFARDKRIVFWKISSTERKNRLKDIRIHVFNLSQKNGCDIKVIAEHQFKRFMLGFWFCVLENGMFKVVSPITYSTIIEESMKGTGAKKRMKKTNNNSSSTRDKPGQSNRLTAGVNTSQNIQLIP